MGCFCYSFVSPLSYLTAFSDLSSLFSCAFKLSLSVALLSFLSVVSNSFLLSPSSFLLSPFSLSRFHKTDTVLPLHQPKDKKDEYERFTREHTIAGTIAITVKPKRDISVLSFSLSSPPLTLSRWRMCTIGAPSKRAFLSLFLYAVVRTPTS